MWTIVGSAAGVASVGASLVIGVIQVRQARRGHHAAPSLRVPDPSPVPAVLATPRPAGLRPPTGRLPEHVRGRGLLIDLLFELASNPDGCTHLVCGLGGTGKTTIVLRVAERALAGGLTVWWIPAADASTVSETMLGVARGLGAAAGEIDEARAGRRDAADLVWQRLEGARGWVLVFDNADDPSVLAAGTAVGDGVGWVRPTHSGLVLVTSRQTDSRIWGRHVKTHRVGWLSDIDGGRVLLDLAPDAGTAADAQRLSARLGGLPLALHNAGLQLAADFATERTFAAYIDVLQSRFSALMSEGTHDREIVTSTWELSLNALDAAKKPQARPLLRVLSWFAEAVPIPPVLLDDTALSDLCRCDRAEIAAGLAALRAVGLIETRASSTGAERPFVLLHPLVAETGRLAVPAEEVKQIGTIAVRMIAAAIAGMDPERPADWPQWALLLPHFLALFDNVGDQLELADLTNLAACTAQAAHALTWGGAYKAAEMLARTAIDPCARRAPDVPSTLALRFSLASAQRFEGHHAEAEAQYRAVLADRLRTLGPDHPDTLATRHGIARALSNQGNYVEAEAQYRAVLADRLRVLGPDHPDTLDTRHGVGYALAAQSRFAEAEVQYQMVLAGQLRILGPDHPATLATRNNFGYVLAGQSRFAEAEIQYRAVLADRLRILGPEHPNTLASRHDIACTLAELGRGPKAKAEFRTVLAERIRILGPDHPDTRATAAHIREAEQKMT
jgi:tetratricopeptide (TPR) repeat protein